MTSTAAIPSAEAPVTTGATLGLVYKHLEQHRCVVHNVGDDPRVQGVELSVGAPLFKGSPQIVAALKLAEGLRDKVDAYFDHALLDDETRVRFARTFASAYIARHPRSERQDLFRASGDVFVFAFDLVQPLQTTTPRVVFDAIAGGPHDAALLARLRGGESIGKEHLRVVLRLFLDHPLNPRRHADADVAATAARLELPRPYVVEATTSLAIPGYAKLVLDEVTADIGAAACCWLD